MIAATLALAAAQVAAPVPPPACTGALCDGERLAPWFARLAQARSGRPVRILQIGDSHTAADQVTGSWRTLLQRRYGSGGRGMLPPGRPYAGYLTRGITAAQSSGWSVAGIFGPSYRGAGAPPIGVSGYTLTGSAGASMSLAADAGQMFDRFTVCAMQGPGGGTLSMTVGATRVDWPLAADRATPACRTIDSAIPATAAAVAVTAGTASLTSWTTERRSGGGVVLANLGTVGAQFVHADRMDERVMAAELAAFAPDLVVVAFGTNEAFKPGFSAAAYDAQLRAGLRRIARLVPGVPMLVLGAPDSATKLPSLQRGEAGASEPCDAVTPLTMTLPTSEIAASASPWRPTAALATVQAIQRARAHQLGAAFWDWSRAMGGRCTTDGWVRQGTPLMRGDHVHFTTPGAARIAALLQADLDQAMMGAATPAGPR